MFKYIYFYLYSTPSLIRLYLSACLLHDASRVYHPGDVHCVPRLHVCNGRPNALLILLLVLVPLLGLERGRISQKPPANANGDCKGAIG
jgi:hypothetical protein